MKKLKVIFKKILSNLFKVYNLKQEVKNKRDHDQKNCILNCII